MQISVNGVNKNIESEFLNLEEVLISENIYTSEGIAVAVNENIIPRSEWKKYQIQNNDKIIIIKAVQGG
ncbi:MAG: sulfur carrier protein ThiS [Bacteroidota bacterium]|jgi:sulfur carrier protein